MLYSVLLAAAFATPIPVVPRAVGKPLFASPTTVVRRVVSDGRVVVQKVTFPTKIQHVVVVYMENRTMDNLLSAYYGQPWPGGGTWDQALDLANPNDPVTPLTSNALEAQFDPYHNHVDFVLEAAGQWSQEPLGCSGACPAGATIFSYVPASQTANYASLITNWAIATHVLQSNEGPSFVAHQYAIAGQSGGIPNPKNTAAPNAAADDPPLTDGNNCARPQDVEPAIDMLDAYPGNDGPHGPMRAQCLEYPTILDEMASAYGNNFYSWQFMAKGATSVWAAPMFVRHLFGAYQQSKDKARQPFALDADAQNFVRNLSGKGNPVRPFAALTYIAPCGQSSDHPYNVPFQDDGPQWIAWLLNAIGTSSYWKSTAVVIVWDDWGGWYDHFTPSPWPYHPNPNPYNNPADPYEWGFRVPLMVVSPYVTSRGYVSSGLRSQGAILNFIESVFKLPSLGADDASNGSDNLGDMFDLSQAPLPYVTLPTTYTPGTCSHL